MKKFLLVTTLISLLALPMVSSATNGIPDIIDDPQDIVDIIENIANWVFAILLALALLFILMAAWQFLSSGGDPMRVEKARNNLLYAVIGIAVALLARGIVELVRVIIEQG